MPPRVMLVLPTQTYRAASFLEAARTLGAEVVIASDETSSLAGIMGDRWLTLDLGEAVEIDDYRGKFAGDTAIDAVVGVDETSVLTAARLAAHLGLHHNPVDAVAATRDKRLLRRRLAAAGVAQPRFAETSTRAATEAISRALATVGFPCVVKPVDLAASRGVIRADNTVELTVAIARIGLILAAPDLCGDSDAPLLLESFIDGDELAIEGIIDQGELRVLAIFDKPDPLDGPFFEETLYVTPSRHDRALIDEVITLVGKAVSALGLRQGPVHAEARLSSTGPVLIEVAARSIGGLCSQALRFAEGRTLEELILSQALGLPLGPTDLAERASGVLMLPIPHSGTLRAVRGAQDARAVPGVTSVTISLPVGEVVAALPEGGRYLGFAFAVGVDPATVEASLRTVRDLVACEIIG